MNEPGAGTVIDIGANVGVVTLDWAARLRGVQIHAYEPHPDTHAVLETNVARNGLSQRVTTYPEAVARGGGTLVLRSSARVGFIVPSVSFDEVVARCTGPVELMKIDAEGGEADILEGASAAALARVRQLVLEYHDSFVASSLARCRQVLTIAGFRCVACDDLFRHGLGILHAVRSASRMPAARITMRGLRQARS